MSDLIDRIFRALPASEWAGEPLDFWAALRPDVTPFGPVSRASDAPPNEARQRAGRLAAATRLARARERRHAAD